MRFLEVVVTLAIKEFEQRRLKLTSRKKRKINSRTHMYLFIKGLSKWKVARLTPEFKKDDPTEMSNYSSLSLLSVPSKILE